jgi:hypothetical protein
MNGHGFTHFTKTFMIVHYTIPNELYLRDARNCINMGMEDGLLRVVCPVIPMTVDAGIGVESLFTRYKYDSLVRGANTRLGNRILLLWRHDGVTEQQ